MPKCPKCGEEIDYLIGYYRYESSNFLHMIDGEPERTFRDEATYLEGEDEYECPLCEKVLFDNEEDALEFLREKRKRRRCKKGDE